ncbi:hypothetical protein [Streptococcus equinus]|uniref:hypothetical protein n=1 Tax=Streptococcus equinus TaxID=1335 RepID=UPI0008E312B4|nr:hypothetical protein [Streptococcus equinus]MEE1326456.1 hypothetical protein [Streptococcus sp.]SFC10932.1 hypothetical protein SAMN05216408_1001 [Streptococcus equinus]
MTKIPLYPIDKDFYLYFDIDDKSFYRAFNQSMYEKSKEKEIVSKISILRKSIPIFLPIFLMLGAFFTNKYSIWPTLFVNIVNLAIVTLICIYGITMYAINFKKRVTEHYKTLTYIKVDCCQEEVLEKLKQHSSKILKIRLLFIVLTIVLGLVFLLFSNVLVLFLYFLMFLVTNYLFIVTTVKPYAILKRVFNK